MSTLVTNTITGLTTATSVTMPTTTKIGATAIVSASAGSATIIAEGGTNTTNIQQGLAKAWCNYRGTTNVIGNSFNISSVSDDATGRFTESYSTSFNDDNYSFTGSASQYHIKTLARATGSTQFEHFYASGTSGQRTLTDPADSNTSSHGDLA
mgnify:FL=1